MARWNGSMEWLDGRKDRCRLVRGAAPTREPRADEAQPRCRRCSPAAAAWPWPRRRSPSRVVAARYRRRSPVRQRVAATCHTRTHTHTFALSINDHARLAAAQRARELVPLLLLGTLARLLREQCLSGLQIESRSSQHMQEPPIKS